MLPQSDLLSRPSAPDEKREPSPVLICFGDSITANGRWVDAPEAGGGWRLVNAGRSGRKTTDIPLEFPPALAAHPEAQGVFILLGVNDLPSRDPRSGEEKVASCLANLQLALDLARERFSPEAIFLAAPCGIDTDGLDSVNLAKGYDAAPPLLASLEGGIAELARANGVRFLSLHNALRPGHYTDGLHPNAEGDAVIARVVGQFLASTAFAPLPAFYLVGDSISIDYHEALESECIGHYNYSRKGGLDLARADLDHPVGANGGDSGAVLEHLRMELQTPEKLPDTLLINCGLHDIKTDAKTGVRQVSLETYQRNLTEIIDLVQGAGKRLVWITTTPLDEDRHNARSGFHRFESDLAAYNRAAVELMSTRDVAIIDLHGFTLGLGEDLYRDHVHFRRPVSLRQASFIRAALDSLVW